MQEFSGSEIIYQNEYIRFHRFSTGGENVFVVPPHAGRHGNITQNLIDHLVAAGKSVYAYELLPATRATGNLSVHGLVDQLDTCFSHISTDPVDVLGVCQGGWLSAIYASLHRDRVSRLALFASPINTHTGEKNVIEDYCRNINLDFHQSVVNYHGGIQPAAFQWAAFSMANPQAVYVDRYIDQFRAIWAGDFRAVAKMSRNNAWYDSPIDLAGTWFMEALRNHFAENRLYNGNWEISRDVVPSLNKITCPVYVYAGGSDNITHLKQAEGILDKVSSKEKYFTVFDKEGHTGVFARPPCIKAFMRQFYEGKYDR